MHLMREREPVRTHTWDRVRVIDTLSLVNTAPYRLSLFIICLLEYSRIERMTDVCLDHKLRISIINVTFTIVLETEGRSIAWLACTYSNLSILLALIKHVNCLSQCLCMPLASSLIIVDTVDTDYISVHGTQRRISDLMSALLWRRLLFILTYVLKIPLFH